jgi:hypothetical protein
VPSAENPRVTPAIDQLVKTALAKKKGERFPSMRDMHRALAQARNDVQDTPAPLVKTDPALPAVVLGVDALGGARPPAAPGAQPSNATPSPQDSLVAFEAFTPSQRRRLRSMLVAGAVVLGAIGGIVLALKRSGGTSAPQPVAIPAPAAAATAPPPAMMPPPAAGPTEPAANAETAPAAGDGDEGAAAPTAPKVAAGASAKTTTGKHKAAKPHRHSAKRKDPVKW